MNEHGITLSVAIRQSEGAQKRTMGAFSKLIEDNRQLSREHFGADLFAGSLNIDVPEPETLQHDLDEGKYQPAFLDPSGRASWHDRLYRRWPDLAGCIEGTGKGRPGGHPSVRTEFG